MTTMSWTYAAFLPLEMMSLFSVWNWSRGSGRLRSLVFGVALAAAVAGVASTFGDPPQSRFYVGFFAIYLLSGLMWAWWTDGLNPKGWRMGEMLVAVLATAMFAIAWAAK